MRWCGKPRRQRPLTSTPRLLASVSPFWGQGAVRANGPTAEKVTQGATARPPTPSSAENAVVPILGTPV